ncbi:MAG: IclR family transcriptional regulator [Rhizobiaceae bacterium]|nr:MAG: IclR family transcriptional regulator [Rhizobiaceae bacterium]
MDRKVLLLIIVHGSYGVAIGKCGDNNETRCVSGPYYGQVEDRLRETERLPAGSQSVDRALALLALVRRHAQAGISLAEIVSQSGLNKPTARRLLLALIRAGLVEQESETRKYFLGEEAFVLGALASSRYSVLEIAVGSLRRISTDSEDTSFFSIRRQDHALCLHREEGAFPIRTHLLQAGHQHPLGIGAGSMAMLACLPDHEIEGIIAANAAFVAARFPRYTADLIRRMVQETRARGWSVNPGLVLANSWAIGMAVRYPDGRVAGALSIAAIDSRMREERQHQLAGTIEAEVRHIEVRLTEMFAPRRTAGGEAA